MLLTPTVYYIWYGTWAGNTANQILTDLALNIGNSFYLNINTTYFDASGKHPSNAVKFGGSTTDAYSRGTQLADDDVEAIVSNAIGNRRLPADPNGVYFVLTSKDVNETSGFGVSYCGWHTYGTIGGTNINMLSSEIPVTL